MSDIPSQPLLSEKDLAAILSQVAKDGYPAGKMAHGYQAKGLLVCIRDKQNKLVDKAIAFDNGYQPAQLLGQWAHYAVVFDREQQKKVSVYINGKKQSNTLDISAVQGSVDNTKPCSRVRYPLWLENQGDPGRISSLQHRPGRV